MTAENPALARLAALAGAIEGVALAAATARADILAACEATLESTLADLPDPHDLTCAPRGEVMRHLRRIHLALQRARRVGHAVAELVTASLAAQGVAPGYGPARTAAQPPRLGRLEVRA